MVDRRMRVRSGPTGMPCIHCDDVRRKVLQVGLHVDADVPAERHPDPARILIARQRMQPVILPVEPVTPGLFMGYADQFAGIAPGPGVIRAAETESAARPVGHQLRAAVAAHIVEGPRDTSLIAGQQ